MISINNLTKVYGRGQNSVIALDRVSFDVNRGEFVCVVGASGCGKSTMLGILARLDEHTSGEVHVHADRIGLMFQESALFPWLTARQNVELALELVKVPKKQRKDRADELLELVHLKDFATKRPHELSGGMRQRVAMARALAQKSEVLLMDEPFGALDAITRDLLHDELEQVWKSQGLTIMFVTHNVREAVRLGDRVVLMTSRPGRVAQVFKVEGDRPRRMEDHVVAEQAGIITDRLREEVRRHGNS
jgi:NitT/TauT family transport system ATP-binding protein